MLLIAGIADTSRAQKITAETNLADALLLGTVSAKAAYHTESRWAVAAGFRYNGWTFRSDDDPRAFQDRRRTFYAGPEYRPADSCGGLWATARLQYEQYNRGGLFGKPDTEEGDAFGVSFGGGYSFRLNGRLRLDTGVLFWSGASQYSLYASPRCGRCLVKNGCKGFFRYDGAVVSLIYSFDLKDRNEKNSK